MNRNKCDGDMDIGNERRSKSFGAEEPFAGTRGMVPDQAGPWRPGENFGLHAKCNGKARSRSPQGRDLIRYAL